MKTSMISIALLFVVGAGAGASVASAQPATASAAGSASGAGSGSAQGSGSAAPIATGSSSAPTTPDPVPLAGAADLRKTCVEAMNSDATFAASIVATADQAAQRKRDADTLKAHADADAHIKENERHVIISYAAMWIVAALFVLFLWRRQQALKTEIAQLRRDLEAAAK